MKQLGKLGKSVVAVTAIAVVATTASACSSSSSAKPEVSVAKIPGGTTSVALDKGFYAALTSLKVMPGLIGTAKLDASTLTLSFPITGGHVKVYKKGDVTPYVQGVIDHQGSGFTLKAGSTTVGLENFVVNPGNNSNLTGEVLVNGKVAVKSTTLFDLDGSTLKTPSVDSSTGVATLTGTTVKLAAGAATLLNKTFKITALKAEMTIGIATIMAESK